MAARDAFINLQHRLYKHLVGETHRKSHKSYITGSQRDFSPRREAAKMEHWRDKGGGDTCEGFTA